MSTHVGMNENLVWSYLAGQPSWEKAGQDSRRAFIAFMSDKLYGAQETRDAWYVFVAGWVAHRNRTLDCY